MEKKIKSIFGFFISTILIIVGIYLIRLPPLFPIPAQFKVLSVTPITTVGYNNSNQKIPIINTVYNLTGSVPDCNGIVRLSGYTKNVSVGTTITAYIHKNCEYNTASQDEGRTQIIGWGLVIFATIFIILNILQIFSIIKFN